MVLESAGRAATALPETRAGQRHCRRRRQAGGEKIKILESTRKKGDAQYKNRQEDTAALAKWLRGPAGGLFCGLEAVRFPYVSPLFPPFHFCQFF